MTDINKAAKKQGGEKAKKLRLNKETVKDLSVERGRGAKVGGGKDWGGEECTRMFSGCG